MRTSSWFRTGLRIVGAAFILAVAIGLGIAGWRVCGKSGQRCEDAGLLFPLYSAETKQIEAVMYDLNKNGLIDTFAYRRGQQDAQFDIDRDEDGTIDHILMFDRYTTVRLRPRR